MHKFRSALIILALATIAAGGSARLPAPWDIAAAVLAAIMAVVSLLILSVRRTVARRSSCAQSE